MCCGAGSELMTRTALYCGVCSCLGLVSSKLQGKRIQAQLQGSAFSFFFSLIKKLFSSLQLSVCVCVLILYMQNPQNGTLEHWYGDFCLLVNP